MNRKLFQLFRFSGGGLLFLTAMAKLISSGSGSRFLEKHDPLLSIPFRYLFWLAGGMELIVALICFFGRRIGLQSGLVAWLATNFLLYRLSLGWIGYEKPCGCLGNLTDALHLSPQTADTAMKIVLAYLLIGSYTALFWHWQQRKKTSP